MATATRLLNNTEHSHVGLVVQMPNKWHGEPELYVLELTNNIDHFIDPFSESPRQGLVLFRLHERLHAFHGGLITHYPLRKQLEGEFPRVTILSLALPSLSLSLSMSFLLTSWLSMIYSDPNR